MAHPCGTQVNVIKISRFYILMWTLGGTQYHLKNWQILKYCVENQQNTKYPFVIG